MKTRVFLLVCLLTGIGIAQLSAQPSGLPKNGKNGSIIEYSVWENIPYLTVPVSCSGVENDLLVGTVTRHSTFHFKSEIWVWTNEQFEGELTSMTGEVFSVKDIFKMETNGALPPDYNGFASFTGEGHINLVGNRGSHYILTYTFNYSDFSYTFVKAVCPGNK
jgi:hypothetical protein